MDYQYFFPLLSRREIASGTIEFALDARGSDFVFRAGQWVDITLINPQFPDEDSNTRAFSMASSPRDTQSVLFAMRIGKSAYKRSLMALPLSTQMKISRASGSFVLHEDCSRPVVFLIGGIGITPVRSMVEWVVNEKKSHKIFLFYTNRTPSEVAYFDDFQKWKQSIDLQFIPTITDSEDPTWKYERGRIDRAMLERHLENISKPFFYIAGPPDMVLGMWQMLHTMDVADEDIKTEEFSGY